MNLYRAATLSHFQSLICANLGCHTSHHKSRCAIRHAYNDPGKPNRFLQQFVMNIRVGEHWVMKFLSIILHQRARVRTDALPPHTKRSCASGSASRSRLHQAVLNQAPRHQAPLPAPWSNLHSSMHYSKKAGENRLMKSCLPEKQKMQVSLKALRGTTCWKEALLSYRRKSHDKALALQARMGGKSVYQALKT